MPNTTTSPAATIRAEIARCGRRSSELAAVLGASPHYVSRRMRGHVEWSASEVIAIAAWLGVSVSQLLGDAAAPRNAQPRWHDPEDPYTWPSTGT